MRLTHTHQAFLTDLVRRVLAEGQASIPCPSPDLAQKLRHRFYTWRRTQTASILDVNPMDISVRIEGSTALFYKKRDLLEEILEGTKTA